jgi:hypothetical protein
MHQEISVFSRAALHVDESCAALDKNMGNLSHLTLDRCLPAQHSINKDFHGCGSELDTCCSS